MSLEENTIDKPQLILHIGMQKTGTSSLQAMCDNNRDTLLSHGLYYPKLPQDLHHNSIAGRYIPASPHTSIVDSDFAVLKSNMLKHQRNLLSSEDFSRIKNIDQLAEDFAEFDCKIVIYVRPQPDWVESLYNQRNKLLFDMCSERLFQEEIPTERDLFHFLRAERYSWMVDYFELIEAWAAKFGDDAITVRPFESEQILDLAADFCNILDIPPMDSGPRRNENISNVWLEFARENGPTVASKLAQLRSEDRVNLSGSIKLLSPQSVSKIYKDYSDCNRNIALKYLGRDWLFVRQRNQALEGVNAK